MTFCRPLASVLILGAALGLSGAAGAASLSPLDPMTGDVLTGLGGDPVLATPDPIVDAPLRNGPKPFKFENDTGLDADPMRGVLPENQWANPQAAQNDLIRRR